MFDLGDRGDEILSDELVRFRWPVGPELLPQCHEKFGNCGMG